ncbi:MAG: hypothetical protein JNL83_23750 [Myxococcales bacterium]|nr:hypothetical protein [Myxococcales bacterium]
MMGLVCTRWFGMWPLSTDALAGVYLSLASSVALLAGGFVWTLEVARWPSAVRGPQAVAFAVSSRHEGFARLRTAVARRRM